MTNKEQTISNLKKLKSFHNGSYGADIDKAIKALEQIRWIPVSEQLPKKEMNCLVTDSLGRVHKVTFYHSLDGRESYFSGCYCVMAWMPLPEPYKSQKESE